MLDAVITYVDSRDENWKREYNMFVKRPLEEVENRFRSYDCLDLQIKLIRKNMKFVDNVYVIVSSTSQVPDNVKNMDGVKIVTHKEIIPKRYLPCFNSCTIEMYMYNIKELKENFIYFNDDMFVVSKCEETDFIKNGKFIIDYEYKDFDPEFATPFEMNVINANRLVDKSATTFIKPAHFCMPLNKNHITEVWVMHKNEIEKSMTRTRHRNNINFYAFIDYEIVNKNAVWKEMPSKYFTTLDNLELQYQDIIEKKAKFICVNDSGMYDDSFIEEFRLMLECLLTKRKFVESKQEIEIKKLIGDSKIVVTMTSWKNRIFLVNNVIKNMLSQTLEPNKIVLNLSINEFPNQELSLPKELVQTIHNNSDICEIYWVKENYKQFKKLVHTLDRFPNDIIISIDDDFPYPSNFVETLYNDYIDNKRQNPISYSDYIDKDCLYTHHGSFTITESKFYGKYLHKILDEFIYPNFRKYKCYDDPVYTEAARINGYEYKEGSVNYNKFRLDLHSETPDALSKRTATYANKRNEFIEHLRIFCEKIKPHEKFNLENEKLIISLTSYPARINYVKDVLFSLINQSVPFSLYHIVLVLAIPEFPNKENDLPIDLINFVNKHNNIIEILWYERNIRSHKKLIPTLKKYPNNPILVCDDDVIRPKDWLKMFLKDHVKYPNDIITGVGKSYLYNKVWYSLSNCFSTKAGNICNFENIVYNTLRPANGFGGTLYPKNTFTDNRFFDENLFMKLTPTSDEMWQWCFNILENRTIRQSSEIIDYSKYILNGTQNIETTLWKVNDGKKYNDILDAIRKELKDIDLKISNIELDANPFKTDELGNYCICSIVNDDFVPGLQTMIYSLLKHNTWFDGDIVILYSDTYSSLSDENMKILRKLYSKIKFVKVDDEKYNCIDVEKNNIPKKFISPLIKCEIFSFTDYDKVLYLDADTLIINSIYELICANNDIIVFTHEFDKIEYPEKLNEHVYTRQIDNKLKSINNGVILVNKNALNKKITESMLSLFSNYNRNCGWYKGCPDQDIMCKYFRESNLDIVIYPNKYNVMKRVFRYNIKKISNECIIHYIMNKPWLTKDDEYAYINNVWHKYFNELKSRNFNLIYEQYRSKILQYMKLVYNISLNLNKPLTIQDKINWIKLYDSSELKTKCSDKILVHEYCKEKLGKDICIPIIKTYTNYKQIRYGQLPDKFVMKCNHGSGWNKIVTDKSKMNGADLYYWMTTWLKKDWSNIAGFELHYKNITPMILVEKYMNDGHDDLIDYKFLCFNGKPTYCQIISDRHNSLRRLNYYDMNFNFVDICRLDFKNNPKLLDKKPANFELMKQYAEKLSEDFNFVRVDFYEIDNKVYLGELTFTPGTGGFKYKNPQDNVNMGNLLKL